MDPGQELIAGTGRLNAFVEACRSALNMAGGLELSLIAILSARDATPKGVARWTSDEAGQKGGLSPATAARLIDYAHSVGLLSANEFEDGITEVALSDAGWAALREMGQALG